MMSHIEAGLSYESVQPYWDAASRNFAQTAKGAVDIFINMNNFRWGDSTFMRIEMLELASNPYVSTMLQNPTAFGRRIL
jgi:hypothetical protein